ncbi:hypothetical protein acdb102_29410 [Acidothermaceae bacterium B102]|nr:hypothetical protein acdb102_29410 [Acidothermaceae bacterium B102]
MRMRTSRGAAGLTTLVLLMPGAVPTPAHAADKAPVTLTSSSPTVQLRSKYVLSGKVTHPVGLDEIVTLQAQVNGTWQERAWTFAGPRGFYDFPTSARQTPQSVVFRVVVSDVDGVRATSGSITVRMVRPAFSVTATTRTRQALSPHGTLVVTGAVSRHATGSVVIDAWSDNEWRPVGSARLTTRSTFIAKLVRPAGAYRLRVRKPATTSVAPGISAEINASWLDAPHTPSLWPVPRPLMAVAGTPYSVHLTVLGGVAPYHWALTRGTLPDGLHLASDGTLSGAPTTAGSAPLSFSVSDAQGRTGSSLGTLSVVPASGVIVGWGDNSAGELGTATTKAQDASPVVIHGLGQVTGFGAAAATGYAIGAGGTLWAWGWNEHGELGNGSKAKLSRTPVRVKGLTHVVSVSGGYESAVALTSDGSVWAWGTPDYGAIDSDHSRTPSRIPGIPPMIAVTTGLALTADGHVWAWGNDSYGELGDSTRGGEIVQGPGQVVGLDHVAAIPSGGGSLALRSDGTVWTWGATTYAQATHAEAFRLASIPRRVAGLADVTTIVGGASNPYALRSDGTLWTWGDNHYGQFGNGTVQANSDLTTQSRPSRVPGVTAVIGVANGYNDTYALSSDGTVWGWGFNRSGKLGAAAHDSTVPSPINVPGLSSVSGITAASDAGFALVPG